VFFNLSSEAKAFAAILITHRNATLKTITFRPGIQKEGPPIVFGMGPPETLIRPCSGTVITQVGIRAVLSE